MKSPTSTEAIKSFTRKVLKESKNAEPIPQMDPLRAVVRGVLSSDIGDAKADEALAVIDREFVDFNELRVATELELQDMLGQKYPDIERRAFQLIAILNAVFEKEGTLNLERIKPLGKKEIRQYVAQLPEMTSYVEAYTMLYGYDYPTIPVDNDLMGLLIEAEAISETATVEEVQKALENALKSDEIAPFHVGVRSQIAARRKK